MRDRIAHEYSGVDLSIVWDAIIEDVPGLERQINEIVRSLENK